MALLEEPWTVAGIATLGGIISSGVQWLLTWWIKMVAQRNLTKDRAHKTTLDEYRELLQRSTDHITMLQEGEEACRKREGLLAQRIVYLHGVACRQADDLRRAGISTAEIEPIDLFLSEVASWNFQAKTVKQNSNLLNAEAVKLGVSNPLTLNPK